MEVYETGCPGSGGFTPFATIAGCPQSGEDIALNVWLGLGGAPGFLMIGFDRATVPQPGGCILRVAPVFVFMPIFLTAGLPGEGTFALPITVPPGMPTIQFTMQAVVFDAGAPGSTAFSNGVQVNFL